MKRSPPPPPPPPTCFPSRVLLERSRARLVTYFVLQLQCGVVVTEEARATQLGQFPAWPIMEEACGRLAMDGGAP